MSNRFEKFGIPRGKIVEEDLFGKSKYEAYYRERFPNYKYHPREQITDLLKRLQPNGDPSNPERPFALALHREVAKRLGINPKTLRFYTAVDSPLDAYHATDGWFEVRIKDGQVRVTIDLKTFDDEYNPKNDIVFEVPSQWAHGDIDKEQFSEYTNNLAREVLAIFEYKGIRSLERRAS